MLLKAVKTLKRGKEVPRKAAEADPVFEAPRLRELHAVSDNFDVVQLPDGASAVPSRFVYTAPDGDPKARLVVQGCFEPGKDSHVVESLTLHRHSVRFLLWLAPSRRLQQLCS